MLLRAHDWGVFALLILASTSDGSSGHSSSITATNNPATCQAGNINYVTNTLPQQCYRSSWQEVRPSASQTGDQTSTQANEESPTETHSFHSTPSGFDDASWHTATRKLEPTDVVDEDPGSTTFISFEDWKDLKAREAGRDAQEYRYESERVVPGAQADGLRAESDIALKVEAVSEELSSIAAPPNQSPTGPIDSEQQPEPVLYYDGKTQYYRSKDAGKTCKERFSYSSFDAGATVLKTNSGAKNAKAILVENKDSYMLLECAAENKFAIVELTDDILIDTVVLANFEFFSSMIRHFKVSVSDRYPVKVDKWKDLGVFEAKNSRDIQPFLVQNPLIWAKYVRIEFLSHYGNEYYCPVSLLRVHGTRMLDSWKETEAPSDEDEVDEEHLASRSQPPQDVDQHSGGSGHDLEDDSVVQDPHVGHKLSSDANYSEVSALHEQGLVPEPPWYSTCPAQPIVATVVMSHLQSNSNTLSPDVGGHDLNFSSSVGLDDVPHEQRFNTNSIGTSSGFQASSSLPVTVSSPTPPPASAAISSTTKSTSIPQSSARNASQTSAGSSKKPSPVAQAPPRSKNTTSTSSPPPAPTVQESFHKAVSKRLQLLESNVTLSLEYLEEQSRFLQQSQQASERRQLAKVDSLLDSLNHTVLSELRNVRQQYDQIWQSTIIALENQREQSERELVALGSRMNVLADEVVFQKRMAILQAILLLSCLVMVIFSRAAVSIPTNQLDMAFNPNRPRRSRLARALYSSGPSPQHHHHLPAAIVEDDLEGESPRQVLGCDVSMLAEVPHGEDSENMHNHSVGQPEHLRLDVAPVVVEHADSWGSHPSDGLVHRSDMPTTPDPPAKYQHDSRPHIPHHFSERLSPPSSPDTHNAQSDELDSTSHSGGGSREPPTPFARSSNSNDGVFGLRKPLPALPEDSP